LDDYNQMEVETPMSTQHLKSLKFVPRPTGTDRVGARRAKLIERLQCQVALARDPSFVSVYRHMAKGDDGKRHLREDPRPIHPWWKPTASGVVFTPRYGGKTLFAADRAGIVVPSVEELVPAIETLIAAVRSGECDEQLRAVAPVGVGKKAQKKRAA
jgi:hypothetical protein